MTVREYIMEMWEGSGGASDLYPFSSDTQATDQIDITAEGTLYFLRILNQAQVALMKWKKKDGRFLRFRKFNLKKNIQLGVDEDAEYIITRNSETQFEIDTLGSFGGDALPFDVDTFENSVMAYDGAYYKIMSANQTTATTWDFYVYPDVPETSGVTYPEIVSGITFGLNEFNVNLSASSPSNTHEVTIPLRCETLLRIDDVEANSEVRRANDKDDLNSQADAQAVGDPEEYFDYGDKIIFDKALFDKHWYQFEFLQIPEDISTLDDTIDLPTHYHQAIVFWGLWKIFQRERNEIQIEVYKRRLDDYLMTIRDEYDENFERSRTSGFKRRFS